ncbi:gap junction alpha-4 protein [Diretmus argenteus]
MSRADWSFLEHLLEEGQEYSTGVGRVWLTVLFLFRMLVLGTAAESAWDDEQAGFVCNTGQPGCTAVCYDKAFPISHFRYFVLQVIFVSTPTIFFFGYVAIRAGNKKREEEERDKRKAEEGGGSNRGESVINRDNNELKEDNKEEEGGEDKGGAVKGGKAGKVLPEAPKLKGKLLCAYAFSILIKVLLEVGFIVGLWLLYDGFFIAAKFECVANPCPHAVDCFVSRPTEKTIFTIYTQAIAGVSLLLNLIELLYLFQLAISHRLEKRYRTQHQSQRLRTERIPARQEATGLQAEAAPSYPVGSHLHLPMGGEDTGYPKPRESYVDVGAEANWGPGEAVSDLLPSYLNCMGGMTSAHSPRVHHKKQAHHHGKHSKGAHKGHSKQKHYV